MELIEEYWTRIGVEVDDRLRPDRCKRVGGNSDRLRFQNLGAGRDLAVDRNSLSDNSSRLRVRDDGGRDRHCRLPRRLPARLSRGSLCAAHA